MNQTDMLLRVEITDFLDRYIASIDENRLNEWPAFFLEDCLYEVISKENVEAGMPVPVMRCEGAPMVRDRVLSLTHANVYEMPGYRHLLSVLRCRAVDGDQAELTANFLVINTTPVGDSSIYVTGKYVARLVRVEGDFRIASMRAIYDTLKIPTLLAFPI